MATMIHALDKTKTGSAANAASTQGAFETPPQIATGNAIDPKYAAVNEATLRCLTREVKINPSSPGSGAIPTGNEYRSGSLRPSAINCFNSAAEIFEAFATVWNRRCVEGCVENPSSSRLNSSGVAFIR